MRMRALSLPSLRAHLSATSCRQLTRPRSTWPSKAQPSWLSKKGFSSVSAADLQFGQPVHETHPHILKAGELTPGITAQEYFDRRARLAERLPVGGIAILGAADLKFKSGAVFHPYRQDSNFLYLTGWNEADSFAVIQRVGKEWGDYVFHLFCQPKDPVGEQWSGPLNGLQAAEDIFNADQVHDVHKLSSVLPDLVRSATQVYTDLERPGTSTASNKYWKNLGRDTTWWPSPPPLYHMVNTLRAIKSPAEVANMRKAGQISGRVITDAMRHSWTREKDLQTFLDYRFTADGCDGPAYVPVVGGGINGNCIHYVLNNNVLRDGETVLVDAGGEYGTYITDISRTWPVNGKFSAAQRDLYQAVLNVQRRCVNLCREDAGLTLDHVHQHAFDGLRSELAQIGFDNLTAHDVSRLFPHHVGHYVGLDVHDTPGYSRSIQLKKGHCVTVEPGVYVPDEERFPKHFRGLGVRIEDSICVQEDTPLVLTTEAVKEIVDIESLRD